MWSIATSIGLLGSLVFPVVISIASNAQLPAATESNAQGFKISDNVDLVLLDVSVRDSSGGLVADLSEGNFQVFEDNHPRQISHFDAFDVPATIGLVVDNSGSMITKRAEVVTAGLAFAKSSNKRDQFFVVNFNDSVTRGLPPAIAFTDNLQLLRNSLYFGKPQGQTALYDAIAYALKHLELASEQRRTLIVVSDGRDNVSKLRLSELIKLIEESRAAIYTIGLYDPLSSELNPGVLRKISEISGGEFFEPKEQSEIAPTFQKISSDVRHCYTIGYAPNETTDKRQTRQVKVVAHANGRKLKVRSRSTYRIPDVSTLPANISG